MRFVVVEKAKKPARTKARVLSLQNNMGHAIQVNFLKGIKAFKKKISASQLLEAWKSGNYQDIMHVIKWDHLRDDLKDIGPPLREDMAFATKFAITALPANAKKNLRYDTSNPKIDRFIDKRTAELVTRIGSDTRKIIATAVRRSFNEAQTPRQIANDIKSSIGLLPQHEIAVQTYRNGLLKSGMNLEKVTNLSDAYTEKLLDYRAMMIGRTESAFAKNFGQLEVWKQADSEGLLPEKSEKVWNNTGPDPCEDCVEMDGVSVGLNEMWVTPDGDMVEVPNEIHPHCNCIMTLEMP